MATSSNNPYSHLDLGRNDVFKAFGEYTDAPVAINLIFNVKNYLMRNLDTEDRLRQVRASILPTNFILSPRSKFVSLYADIRTAMITYDIPCVTNLRNGTPIWKKLVHTI